MKVSLIMATLGRTSEVEDFIKSLLVQGYNNYELIVVDQNSHKELKLIIDKYIKRIPIKYIRSSEKGLSLNRNKGLEVAEGDIIAFPDDDCEYPANLLYKIIEIFKSNPELGMISMKTLEKGQSYGIGKMKDKDCNINTLNILETLKSITMFIKKGGRPLKFDELLGAGKDFGSGEETDYALQYLHKGIKGRYFSDLVVYHPAKKGDYNNLEREFKYALGFGAISKKEIVYRRNCLFLIIFFKKTYRNFLGMLFSKNRRYHLTILKGKVNGFLKY